MSTFNLLSAIGFDDLLGAIVPIAFFIFWIISNVAGARQKNAQQGQRPAMPADDPVGQDALETEIGKFLKQAKNKRAGGDVEIFDPAAEPLFHPPLSEPIEAELLSGRPADELINRHTVSSRVAADLDTRPTRERIERMGDNVEVADEVMAAHVREVFEHPIGSLTDTSDRGYEQDQTADDPESDRIARTPTAAVDFAALLGNTDNLRQAIVMNEILQRPVDRW